MESGLRLRQVNQVLRDPFFFQNAFNHLAVALLGVGGSSIHFLARPHLLTLVLLSVSVWMIEEDRRRPSWREKLDLVRGVLANETLQLSNAELTNLAIYLRFLGAGEIACAEDGRHYRPSHHSRLAVQIHERLRRVASPANAYIVRKIYPWLPSADTAFTRPEPLTRIRDIAHRNDIPRAIKQEIKHELQNKLHRCAGPEDLVTSTEILKRVKPLLNLIMASNVVVSATLAVFERRMGDRGATEMEANAFTNMLKFVGLCHRAGARVVALWTLLYPIPLDFHTAIIPHKQIASKACPGSNFPYDGFEKLVTFYRQKWEQSTLAQERIGAFKLKPYVYV